jgi:hypothetical protein
MRIKLRINLVNLVYGFSFADLFCGFYAYFIFKKKKKKKKKKQTVPPRATRAINIPRRGYNDGRGTRVKITRHVYKDSNLAFLSVLPARKPL